MVVLGDSVKWCEAVGSCGLVVGGVEWCWQVWRGVGREISK